jgi:hypothetical protein
LKLEYDGLLSNFAFKLKLRRCTPAPNQFLVQHSDARKPGGGMWVGPRPSHILPIARARARAQHVILHDLVPRFFF